MSKDKQHFQNPMTFNNEELESRFQKAKERYYQGYECVERFECPTALVLTKIYELFEQGYTASKLPCSSTHLGGVYFYVRKPEEVQEQDLLKIYNDIETQYREEIERHNAAQVSLLAEQLYQQQLAKARKQAEEKEQKERAAAMKEAEEYVASLLSKE